MYFILWKLSCELGDIVPVEITCRGNCLPMENSLDNRCIYERWEMLAVVDFQMIVH